MITDVIIIVIKIIIIKQHHYRFIRYCSLACFYPSSLLPHSLCYAIPTIVLTTFIVINFRFLLPPPTSGFEFLKFDLTYTPTPINALVTTLLRRMDSLEVKVLCSFHTD